MGTACAAPATSRNCQPPSSASVRLASGGAMMSSVPAMTRPASTTPAARARAAITLGWYRSSGSSVWVCSTRARRPAEELASTMARTQPGTCASCSAR
eukprot:scaffold123716_cov69-Phaeocystis_antarctica.AAC.2